jgi:hypothetical protein
MEESRFCQLYSEYYNEEVSELSQIPDRELSGYGLKEFADFIESKIVRFKPRFAHVGVVGSGIDVMSLRSAIDRLEHEAVILVSRDNCIVDRGMLESHLETLKGMEIPEFAKREPIMITKISDIPMPDISKDQMGHKRPYKYHR